MDSFPDRIFVDVGGRFNSEEGYFNILKEKLAVNTITPEARAQFVNKVQSVWKYYTDKNYFTQAEINEALAIASK